MPDRKANEALERILKRSPGIAAAMVNHFKEKEGKIIEPDDVELVEVLPPLPDEEFSMMSSVLFRIKSTGEYINIVGVIGNPEE